MKKIDISEIKNILDYEKVRDEAQARIIALKKNRRVQVGELISFVFENRETVWFQIQEMVRAERIVDEKKIQNEIDVYNEMIPGESELSATMFIEIQDQSRIRETLESFLGITRPGMVYLAIGNDLRVDADIEKGREEEETGRLAAVQYVKFLFSPLALDAFLRKDLPVALVVDHPNYQARQPIEAAILDSLASDFAHTK